MTSKINIIEIATGHIKTLSSANGQTSYVDVFVFYIIPISISIIAMSCSFSLDKDITSLLVNFGSIFTALLLSVLVLVYDQESKLEQNKEDGLYLAKKRLLRDLYYNISYSILCALFLVLTCFIQSVVTGTTSQIVISSLQFTFKYDVYLTTPIIVFITSNLFLSIIMIVKRMHTLLTTRLN